MVPSTVRWNRLPELVAALLVPVLISLLWGGWLLRAPQAVDRKAGWRARKMDRVLAATEPQLVLVGNSVADENIHLPTVADQLGLSAANLTLPGSTAPAWHVIVKDRVYGGGHEPQLVIVAGLVDNMLVLEPTSDLLRLQMQALSRGPDPAVQRRMAGTESQGLATQLTVRSAQLRKDALNGLRNVAIGMLLAPSGPEPVARRGQLLANHAVTEVLGNGQGGAPALQGWLAAPGRVDASVRVADPGMSFVADTIDWVHQHGGELVYVRTPTRAAESARIPPERTKDLAAYLQSREVPFVDLSTLALDDAQFTDAFHLTPSGRDRVTQALLEALHDLGYRRRRSRRPGGRR